MNFVTATSFLCETLAKTTEDGTNLVGLFTCGGFGEQRDAASLDRAEMAAVCSVDCTREWREAEINL